MLTKKFDRLRLITRVPIPIVENYYLISLLKPDFLVSLDIWESDKIGFSFELEKHYGEKIILIIAPCTTNPSKDRKSSRKETILLVPKLKLVTKPKAFYLFTILLW